MDNEMADKLGCQVRTYRSYEYETKSLPNEIVEKLINILSINANWLFTGNSEIFNKPSNEPKSTFGERLSELNLAKLDIAEKRISELTVGKTQPTTEEITNLRKFQHYSRLATFWQIDCLNKQG